MNKMLNKTFFKNFLYNSDHKQQGTVSLLETLCFENEIHLA